MGLPDDGGLGGTIGRCVAGGESRTGQLLGVVVVAGSHVLQGPLVAADGLGQRIVYADCVQAARCAIEIQRRLQAQRKDAFALTLRIGLHSGEAVVDSGDILGTVVNLAARVMSEAAPGEVLITETIADHLDARFQVEDRGLRTLKGFKEPRHLLALHWEDPS